MCNMSKFLVLKGYVYMFMDLNTWYGSIVLAYWFLTLNCFTASIILKWPNQFIMTFSLNIKLLVYISNN